MGGRDELSSYWMVSGKATAARAGALFGLAAQMLTEVQLDNPSRVVEIDLLFGGRSGSLVLTAKVKSSDGLRTRVETNCVVKVDKDENLIEEEENTQKILPHLGENAPKVLCGGAHYEDLPTAVSLGRCDATVRLKS